MILHAYKPSIWLLLVFTGVTKSQSPGLNSAAPNTWNTLMSSCTDLHTFLPAPGARKSLLLWGSTLCQFSFIEYLLHFGPRTNISLVGCPFWQIILLIKQIEFDYWKDITESQYYKSRKTSKHQWCLYLNILSGGGGGKRTQELDKNKTRNILRKKKNN